MLRRLDSPDGWFMINRRRTPPSSSGLGYLVLSQGTGVRVPVGVLQIEPSARGGTVLASYHGRYVRVDAATGTLSSEALAPAILRRFVGGVGLGPGSWLLRRNRVPTRWQSRARWSSPSVRWLE